MNLTSKQRAYLLKASADMAPVFNVGKASLTPDMVEGISQALKKRELIKVSVLKNCADDPAELARMISERTHSAVVRVIGKKIILFKQNPDKTKRRYFTEPEKGKTK